MTPAPIFRDAGDTNDERAWGMGSMVRAHWWAPPERTSLIPAIKFRNEFTAIGRVVRIHAANDAPEGWRITLDFGPDVPGDPPTEFNPSQLRWIEP